MLTEQSLAPRGRCFISLFYFHGMRYASAMLTRRHACAKSTPPSRKQHARSSIARHNYLMHVYEYTRSMTDFDSIFSMRASLVTFAAANRDDVARFHVI